MGTPGDSNMWERYIDLTFLDGTARRRRRLRQHPRLPLLRLPQGHGYDVCFECKCIPTPSIHSRTPLRKPSKDLTHHFPPPQGHDQNPLPHTHPRPRQIDLLLDECHHRHRQHHDQLLLQRLRNSDVQAQQRLPRFELLPHRDGR